MPASTTVSLQRSAILAGETSISEVVEAALARAAALEGLGIMRHVREREAQAEAAMLDALVHREGPAAAGRRPLLGMPITVKELIPVAGVPYSRGADGKAPVADADAPAVRRLREAGCVVLGTTCSPADGWCAASLNGSGPPTRNPWNPELTAGGSSAGSAVAVATGIGSVSLGTDGAGSVRIPASFCGVVGYKPSFGRAPYVPLCGDGLSHLGVLAGTVDDAAKVAAAIAGPDAADPSSLLGVSDLSPSRNLDEAARLRIAWVPTLGETSPSAETARVCLEALKRLASAGHFVEAIAPPVADPYAALAVILGAAEAQVAAVPAEAHPVRAAIRQWAGALTAADLAAAFKAKLQTTVAYTRVLGSYDILAVPTMAVPPFPAEAPAPARFLDPARDWLRWTPNTYVLNLTGQPAVTVPVGLSSAGLPIGLQVVAGRGRDVTALFAAAAVERSVSWPAEDAAPLLREGASR
jgi:aspartyl-tRNA(Asn)/glutamyl-tRNA(Gln) amidotransferase subunit A